MKVGNALVVALGPLTGLAAARTIEGKVVGVSDGDSITVLDADKRQHKIRLGGIDAPEKKQAFGQRSKASLSSLVFAKTVEVETSKIDRYGRSIGRVLVAGQDANLEQLRRGFAWHYKQHAREQPEQERELYRLAEEAARDAKIGLWRDSRAMPPWEFRQAVRREP